MDTTQATSTATPQALSFMNNASFDATTGKALNEQGVADLTAVNTAGGIAPTTPFTGYVAPKVSTTTLSNQNKIDAIPGIVGKTNQLAQTGISTDANGNATYANGTIVPQPTGTKTDSVTNANGGYVGDMYYPAGAELPTGADGKPLPLRETSETDDRILGSLNAMKSQSDALTASLIDGIHAQYAQLRQQQQDVNKRQEAGVETALLTGGVTGKGSSAQYAPISSIGIMQAQISYGLQQISDLNSKEQGAILAAQQAGMNRNFELMDKINTEIDSIRDEKVTAATKLNDQIREQNQKLADEKLQSDKDTAIAELYDSGVTDPKEILKQLRSSGLNLTSKEVADTITNITPSIQERQMQRAAIQYAVDHGVTQPFYLVGNTAIDVNTGMPVSLKEYQAATGQAGKSEAETDFSFIQHLATPEVQALMDKYVDAGIVGTDTIEQAKAKLANSKVYQKETYIARPTGPSLGVRQLSTVGGTGLVAGVKVPQEIAGDVEDVLTGRNTLYNIRQTMGRTNAAAAYMQSMRNAIKSIDPKFDFVASDAGGKFVSSTYFQRSAAAINSVLPNIDKIVELSNEVDRVGVAGVDSLLQKGAVQIGNQKVANFREAQKLIADEIGLALGQGTVSDMKLQLGFDVTDPSVSPEVFASNMGVVKEFIQNRLKGLNDQRYSSSVTDTTSEETYTVDGKTYVKGSDGLYYEQ